MAKQSGYWLSFFSGAALLLFVGCSKPAVIPTNYALYNSKGGTFQCELPEGWETKGGGTGGRPEWAKALSGSALIHIRAGVVGSLVNDIAGGSDPNRPPQFQPVHFIHVAEIEKAEEEYDEYTELPGSPLVMDCGVGPVRLSEFTAKSGSTEIHGYRGTIMGHNKMLRVFCTCTESEWQALKPSFDKVFLTMERGERRL